MELIFLICYFTIGIFTTTLILIYNIFEKLNGNKNIEHWAGVLIINTLFWFVVLFAKTVDK